MVVKKLHMEGMVDKHGQALSRLQATAYGRCVRLLRVPACLSLASVLLAWWSGSSRLSAQFVAEVQMMRNLRHPSIVLCMGMAALAPAERCALSETLSGCLGCDIADGVCLCECVSE